MHTCPESNLSFGESGNSHRSVILMGFDFGSTTSSAVAAKCRIGSHRFSGDVCLERPAVIYRSTPVFTPFREEELEVSALGRIIDSWMTAAGLEPDDIFSGGAIVTGLAATRANAGKIASLVRQRAGESLIATADDPALESWLAFMGNCLSLSKRRPRRPILNLDIGGGTTNPALGADGIILSTGCAFVGARHLTFTAGTYRLTGISAFGKKLLDRLNISAGIGETLQPEALDRLLGWMTRCLEEMASGHRELLADPRFAFMEQLPFVFPPGISGPHITFSGGVGELVYRAVMGKALPGTTAFGDLGIDLARRIADSPILSTHLRHDMPETGGHATVYGLALHHTEISGTTLYLPDPQWLPLKDLPVVSRLRIDATEDRIIKEMQLAGTCKGGCAIQVTGLACRSDGSPEMAAFRNFGRHLASAMNAIAWPSDRPLVLLLENNCGKTVGNYATGWGRAPLPILALDEIADRDAQFVTIGRPKGPLVPVSFFGMHHTTAHNPSVSQAAPQSCRPSTHREKTEEQS